ncbi:MAG: hypothetical protein ACRERU_14430, partial [Methylococcales bacterium]
ITALEKRVSTKDDILKMLCAQALGKLGPAAATSTSITALLKWLENREPHVQEVTAITLACWMQDSLRFFSKPESVPRYYAQSVSLLSAE